MSPFQLPLRRPGEWEVAWGGAGTADRPCGCLEDAEPAAHGRNSTGLLHWPVLTLWINRRHQPSVPAICYLSRAFQLSQSGEGGLIREKRFVLTSVPLVHASKASLAVSVLIESKTFCGRIRKEGQMIWWRIAPGGFLPFLMPLSITVCSTEHAIWGLWCREWLGFRKPAEPLLSQCVPEKRVH